MSKRIHALAQHFFGKDSLDDVGLGEIRNLVQRHPYISAAQFLLMEKLRSEDNGAFQAQVQRSILYYHDPVSFQLLLEPERFYTEMPEILVPAEPISLPNEEEEPVEPGKSIQPENEFRDKPLPEIEGETLSEVPLPSVKLPDLNAPASSDLTFEPFHTVDYFASQGIKLSQEDLTKDKFGKQLKSFTEWLKDMKRIKASEPLATVDTKTENKVQHLADDSINQSDVYTEAMAEVWIKQGNKSKAIEVYNKLSLLNPSKKAYFATQIENLKSS
jgi:hypothetical protein